MHIHGHITYIYAPVHRDSLIFRIRFYVYIIIIIDFVKFSGEAVVNR